jgi:hypothetical protein
MNMNLLRLLLVAATAVSLFSCREPGPTRQNPSPAPGAGGEATAMPVDPGADPAGPETGPETKTTPVTLPVTSPVAAPPPPPAKPAPDPGCADVPDAATSAKMYPWPRRAAAYESWCARHPVPAGYTRVGAPAGSWAHWLRHLPALPAGTPVKDYQGNTLISASAMTTSVIDLDVGTRDLQQCMDVILRLRAEWHWWKGTSDRIKFRYAGGIYYGLADWQRGLRPEKVGGRTQLSPKAGASSGRKSLEKYLLFMYAMTGTAHNTRELPVTAAELAPGDFFIEPSPSVTVLGHALVVLDVARDARGRLKAVIAQGYTPARDMHVLKADDGSAWFTLDPAQPVTFPSWGNPYGWDQVMRFRN